MGTLLGKKLKNIYRGFIHTDDDLPIDATLKKLEDGDGGDLGIEVSTTTVKFTKKVEFNSIAAASTDTDKFMVLDGEELKTRTGNQLLADLNLDQVNNTPDSSKPVSTAQAAADLAAENAAKAYADSLVIGLIDDRGNHNASGNVFPSSGGSGVAGAVVKGDLWTVSVGGTLGGSVVTPGDLVRALVDTPGQTSSNWAITENNIGYVAENTTNKDATGGYVGLSAFKIKLKNAAGTITSLISSIGTSAREYVFPDKDITIAGLDDTALYSTASGTDTYAATISPAPTSYIAGKSYKIKFTNANTGASSINLNSLGVKSIKKNGSTDLAATDIKSNQIYELVYDGTNFQLLAWIGATGGGGDLLSTNNLSDLANASTARTNLGLANVNNTSDSSKPVSTAQAAADLAAENAAKAYADGLITAIKDGVASGGDTLQKLYNLVVGADDGDYVADITARNAYDIPHLPYTLFVTNDGDGNWAKYQATTTGVGATFVKISDPDLLNAVMSAASIKASYESNADTNALTNALLAKLNAIEASANNYSHPNHSGEITSTGDGATVLGKTAITNRTADTPVAGDYILFSKTADSNNLYKSLISDLPGGGGSSIFSDLTDANNTKTLNNAAYAQVWGWNSLNTQIAMQWNFPTITTGSAFVINAGATINSTGKIVSFQVNTVEVVGVYSAGLVIADGKQLNIGGVGSSYHLSKNGAQIRFAVGGGFDWYMTSSQFASVIGSGPLLASTSTAAAPSFSFVGNTNTGIYRVGANSIGFSLGGSLKVSFGTYLDSGLPVLMPAGTTSLPSFRIPSGVAPFAPTNGDIWSDGTDILVRLGGTTYKLDKTP